MRILIFGNGYIGNKFKKRLPDAFLWPTDITQLGAVNHAIDVIKPEIVLNCAGKTGRPNVDWCEDHKEETMASNVLGPLVIARACLARGILMVHIGSGCIYTGDNDGNGFTEDDTPNFFGSFYSRTKIISEQILKEFPILQLRLRMPFDSEPSPRNFITKIVNYKNIISVPNSISVINDFITASLELINRKRTGIYNMTNPGAMTNAEILNIYREHVDPSHSYKLINLNELSNVVKTGRSNCILNTNKLAAEGIIMPPIEQAVRNALKEYALCVRTPIA